MRTLTALLLSSFMLMVAGVGFGVYVHPWFVTTSNDLYPHLAFVGPMLSIIGYALLFALGTEGPRRLQVNVFERMFITWSAWILVGISVLGSVGGMIQIVLYSGWNEFMHAHGEVTEPIWWACWAAGFIGFCIALPLLALCMRLEPSPKEIRTAQREFGEEAFAAITLAAAENEIHCQSHVDAGPMRVTQSPQNAGAHSVFVYLSGTNCSYGGREDTMYFALQLNIYVRDNRIVALFGRYGPREEVTLDQFDDLLDCACTHVRNWRLYLREAA